jgi:hypothetical protein
MIDLDTAFALCRDRISKAKLDAWPEVWSLHMAGDRVLGDMSGRVGDEVAETVFWLMTPFAYTVEMTDAFVIFEADTASNPYTLDTERVLYVTRLSEEDRGHRTTHWVVPYSILEGGIRLYDLPYKSPFFVPKLNEALGLILDMRQSRAVFSYDESVAAALQGRGVDEVTDL